mmetsp:Transcript_42953/g.110908  ORF Transcript_42953/g.110908 Transcript_42953/m.110908 type:complete len:260 (-) Transcript_42953:1046-1825(-)
MQGAHPSRCLVLQAVVRPPPVFSAIYTILAVAGHFSHLSELLPRPLALYLDVSSVIQWYCVRDLLLLFLCWRHDHVELLADRVVTARLMCSQFFNHQHALRLPFFFRYGQDKHGKRHPPLRCKPPYSLCRCCPLSCLHLLKRIAHPFAVIRVYHDRIRPSHYERGLNRALFGVAIGRRVGERTPYRSFAALHSQNGGCTRACIHSCRLCLTLHTSRKQPSHPFQPDGFKHDCRSVQQEQCTVALAEEGLDGVESGSEQL